MTAVFAPSGNLVGCGGMDNMLTIYDINDRDSSGIAKMLREFLGYEGFLSSCRFLDDTKVVTGNRSQATCDPDEIAMMFKYGFSIKRERKGFECIQVRAI